MCAENTPNNNASSQNKSTVSVCVHCGKPIVKDYFPFCSKRCKSVDLHRWLSGHYIISRSLSEDDSIEE